MIQSFFFLYFGLNNEIFILRCLPPILIVKCQVKFGGFRNDLDHGTFGRFESPHLTLLLILRKCASVLLCFNFSFTSVSFSPCLASVAKIKCVIEPDEIENIFSNKKNYNGEADCDSVNYIWAFIAHKTGLDLDAVLILYIYLQSSYLQHINCI